MKKILSLILVLGLFMSVFTTVSADEAVVEEAPVISEEYINNVAMLKALEIGDFTDKVPTDKVTRGDFAIVIASLLDAQDIAGAVPFADMEPDSPYYNAVSIVYSCGIMNGVSPVRFAPEEYITYEQAVKCIVSILGYGDIARKYPDGYIDVAIRLRLLTDLGTNINDFTWEKAIKLVVNSFDVAVMEMYAAGTNSADLIPSDNLTILGKYHNIYKSKGIITDNGITTVTGAPVQSREFMTVNGIKCFIEDDSMREYIGQKIGFYYQVTDTYNRILYIDPDSLSQDNLVIKADDLVKDSDKFTKTNIVYSIGKKSYDAKIHQYAEAIYNGKSFPTFLVDDLKIDEGTITLVDNDDDNVYDLILIEEYRDFIIKAVDTVEQTITDENGTIYSYDPEKVHAYFYNAELKNAAIAEFVNGYIVSLFESKDGEYRKFIVSGKTATGTVNGLEELDDEVIVSIEDVPYQYSATFLANIANDIRDEFIPTMGSTVKVYLNFEGKISSIDLAARDFLYAYCLGIAPKTGGGLKSGTVQLRVVTEKNDDIIIDAAKNVEINGVKSKPADLLTIPAFENSKTGEFVPQLVRIKTNAKGELKMLMTASTYKTDLGFTDRENFSLATSYGAGSTSGRGYASNYATKADTVYFRLARADNYHEPEVMVVKSAPSNYANMKIYDVDEFWCAGAMVFQDNDGGYMGRVFIVTEVFTTFKADRTPVKAIRGLQQSNTWTYVEAEEGLIDHYIPQGVKVGDIVQLQVDDAKNIRTIKKMFSLADKQTPVTVGSISTDGTSYVYGYLCNKSGTSVVISMDNYALDTTANIQMRSVPTSALIKVFDVQDKTFRTTTLREIPINATMQGGRYNIIDENMMVFAKTSRASATEFIFIKY